MTYIFSKQLTNYTNFLEYISRQSSSSNISNIRYSSDTHDIEIKTVSPLSTEQESILSTHIDQYTNDWEVPVEYIYLSNILPKIMVSSVEYTVLFAWTYNGTSKNRKFAGISILSYIDNVEGDYDIRVVDLTNRKTISSLIDMNNTTENRRDFLIPQQLLPLNASDLEVHIRTTPNASVIINGLQFITRAN